MAAVCALALFLRLGHVLSLDGIESSAQHPRFPLEDDMEYHEAAARLATDPDSGLSPARVPGYTLFCYPFYQIDPTTGFRGVWIAQAVLGAASCLLLFGIGNKLGGYPVGLLSALLWSCQFETVVYCGRLMRETLFSFLWLLVGYLGIPRREKITLLRSLLVGVAGALLACVRPEGAFLVGVYCLWLLWDGRNAWPASAGKAALVLLLLVPPVVSVGLHAKKTVGVFAPLGLYGPKNFYLGNHSDTGKWGFWHKDLEKEIPELAGKNLVQQSPILLDRAKRFIREHPTDFLRGLVYKAKVFLFGTYKYWQASAWTLGEDLVVRYPPLVSFPLVGYGALLLTGCYGLFHIPKKRGWNLVGLWAGSYFLVHVLVITFSRGRLCLLPFLSLASACGILAWWSPFGKLILRNRRTSDIRTPPTEGTGPQVLPASVLVKKFFFHVLFGALALILAWQSRWVSSLFDFSPPPIDIVSRRLEEGGDYLTVQTDVGTRVEKWVAGELVQSTTVETWNGTFESSLPKDSYLQGKTEYRFFDRSGNRADLLFDGLDVFELEKDLNLFPKDLTWRERWTEVVQADGRECLHIHGSARVIFGLRLQRSGSVYMAATCRSEDQTVKKVQVTVANEQIPPYEIQPGSWQRALFAFDVSPGLVTIEIQSLDVPSDSGPPPTGGLHIASVILSLIPAVSP